jgi:hypothetical protein
MNTQSVWNSKSEILSSVCLPPHPTCILRRPPGCLLLVTTSKYSGAGDCWGDPEMGQPVVNPGSFNPGRLFFSLVPRFSEALPSPIASRLLRVLRCKYCQRSQHWFKVTQLLTVKPAFFQT